jgi:CHAD domain-containing protein
VTAEGTEVPATADPEEIELKFAVLRVPPARRLVEADLFEDLVATGPSVLVRIEDTYIDTASRRLANADWTARFRQADHATSVTLKSAPRGDGPAYRRSELEGPADRATAPETWPPSNARDRLIELTGGEPLVELVTLEQRRRKRNFASDGLTVEVSLDRVVARSHGVIVDRTTELEVELKSGDPAELVGLRAGLEGRAFLADATTSKLEWALAAVVRVREKAAERQAALPKLVTGSSPGVAPTDPLDDAGRKVMRFHLARLIAREPGARTGEDPEELHKMRVAIRRLRASWRVFGAAFQGRHARRIRDDLDELATRLGAARDLDVQLLRIGDDEATRKRLAPLIEAWEDRRDAARTELIEELDSPRHRRWVEAYAAFVELPATETANAPRTAPTRTTARVRDRAGSQIWAAYEHVLAYDGLIAGADTPTLHGLRIAAKRLRYSIEFFREALAPEAADIIARITALQDHLGLLNDADVAVRMTRAFLGDSAISLAPSSAAAVARYIARQEREIERLRRRVSTPWQRVSSHVLRRRLARIIASL